MKKRVFPTVLLIFSLFTLMGCSSKKDNSTSSNIQDDCSSLKFNVVYYLNDGTDTVYLQEEVSANKTTEMPANPTRDGYRFRGWCVDSECLVSFDFNTTIKSNTSLYARWFATGGTTSSEDTSSDISTGEDVSSDVSSDVSTSVEVTSVTYTIDSLPNWITDDDCVIFAWVWSETNKGEWVSCEFDSTDSTKLSFTVDEEINGMLLVRCVSGTTTPDWSIKKPSNDPGRIYNQTEDIVVANGVTTYSCSTWKEYN